MAKSKSAPTVGIDIGTSLIKVAEAREGRDGVQITSLGIGPTPSGAIDNEIIVDPQALGQAIRDLLKENGITCKRCVSSVAGQSSVVVRIIEVPKMTPQELVETMKWEVERHVPFAADEVRMDFQPVEREDDDPDAQNMEVLLAVAQQEVINSHLEALFAAGLEPVAIDVEPLATCRSLIDAGENGLRTQAVAVISIGATTTELGVYKNGLLAFPRTLPIAGDTLTRTISEALHISEEQAERVKREKAAVLMDQVSKIQMSSALTGMDSGMDYGAPDEPVDFSALGATDDQSAGMGGFIPGLGFMGQEENETKTAEPTNTGMPDFDIDVAATEAKPAKSGLDFDLSIDESPAQPPSAVFDLADDSTQAQDSGFDVSALGSLGPDEHPDFAVEQIFDAMAPALGDLISEIRRSLEYYTGRYQTQPETILLCGGTARIKDLDKLLQSELGIPVVLANPLQNMTVFSNRLSDDYLQEVASVLPVSVGLAIRDMIGE